MSYGILKVKFVTFARTTQNNDIKLYIFGISIKFRVDWYIRLRLKRKLKFGLDLAGIQKVPAKIQRT